MSYDAVVVGASFAGLTLANRIRGRILLVDRKKIGARRTSACATPLEVLDKLDCREAVLEVVEEIDFSTPYGTVEYKLPRPFCTFSYHLFCQRLLAQFKGDFLKTEVTGLKDNTLTTEKGDFSAAVIVDCTGFRASLASGFGEDFTRERGAGFGLETEVPYKHDRLSFTFDSSLLEPGYAWVFPAGEAARFGVYSYKIRKDMTQVLEEFLKRFDLKPGKIHGGYVPQGLRRPTLNGLFLVGDSAGQVLPLTAEGIRQSVYFGLKCADIVQRIINNELSLEEGLREYRLFVDKYRTIYRLLFGAQSACGTGPNLATHLMAKTLGYRPLSRFLFREYFDWFDVASQVSTYSTRDF